MKNVEEVQCRPIPENVTDLSGSRWGKLTVLGFVRFSQQEWAAKCDCGQLVIAPANSIKKLKHCGCGKIISQSNVETTREQISRRLGVMKSNARSKGYSEPNFDIEIALEALSDPNVCCGICGDTKNGLVIDHCHDSGFFRGILCANCNAAIGLLQDSPLLIWEAYRYVSRNGPNLVTI